jgi:alpha-D-ribose 1-methylphosphonate 5-triphosphate diphosphatase PhnM
MNAVTARPNQVTTKPPTSSECAYASLLDTIRNTAVRNGDIAWSVALALETENPAIAADLAPRLYEVIKHG